MPDIYAYYNELGGKCTDILKETLDKTRLSAISGSHAAVFDYTCWLEILKNRPEYDIIEVAIREYQNSLLCNNLGLYNHAFLGLRYFYERTLTAIMFSSQEIEFRLWLRGERDTYWTEIMHDDTGLFSHKFCRAFFPELKDEILHYKGMAKKVYRECSEYVHGNYAAQTKLPKVLQFDENLFNQWHNKAETIRIVILMAFCLRYLRLLGKDERNKIEHPTLDLFGTLVMIREQFEKTI